MREILGVVIENVRMAARVHREPMVMDEGFLRAWWRPDILVDGIFHGSTWSSWPTGRGESEMFDGRKLGYVYV